MHTEPSWALARWFERVLGCAKIGILAALLLPLPIYAATYYVSPNGNDSNAGTQSSPFKTMAKGQTAASAGDTVYIRGGNYSFASSSAINGVLLNKSGSQGNPIRYFAYPGEKPVFDFSKMTAQDRITGIRVTGSWIHIKGLELKGVPQNITTANESWGIYNTGSNNTYEALNLHHHMGPGLFIGAGSYNLVLNCDSHHNYDPKSKAGAGENADGFGCHGKGTGNVFRGCRAWWNTDDGYDSISSQGTCLFEDSWAFYNGYMPDTFNGVKNGNGFKAGGYGTGTVPSNPPVHTIRNCLAFQNRAAGFYANHHPVACIWQNNTGYKNGVNFNMLGLNSNVGVLRNNLAYGGTTLSNGSGIDAKNNSWNLSVSISDADFESVSTAGVDGARRADGSLPDIGFMKLRAGSDLINKGVNVGLPYVGSAPDLGAFEYGESTTPVDPVDPVDPVEPDDGADDDSSSGWDCETVPGAGIFSLLASAWLMTRRRRSQAC